MSGTRAAKPRARPPACRLYAIVASKAPVAVVFRRGPSRWWHVLRWELEGPALVHGAWLRASLYPRRSNISPDGRLLGYFAFDGHKSAGEPWYSYFAISKVPWLTALAAWSVMGTWTTGCRFTPSGLWLSAAHYDPKPFHGRSPIPLTDSPAD